MMSSETKMEGVDGEEMMIGNHTTTSITPNGVGMYIPPSSHSTNNPESGPSNHNNNNINNINDEDIQQSSSTPSPTTANSTLPSTMLFLPRKSTDTTSTGEPAPQGGPRRGSIFPIRQATDPTKQNGQAQAGGSKSNKKKQGEGYEMDAVGAEAKEERMKQEEAMAKWRKWVAENGATATPINTSPINQRAAPISSPIATPLSPTSQRNSRTIAPSSPTSRNCSADSTANVSRKPSQPYDEMDVYNTESVRALRDVELAVDEDVLLRSKRAESRITTRQMSTHPRLSHIENPFTDLAPKMSSRRVRPIVLELAQALGHYIDALWNVQFSGEPCPWINEPAQNRRASLVAVASLAWTSKVITAVQEGKRLGYVNKSPVAYDVNFWESEVRCALTDVDEVVGIIKGSGRAFKKAMEKGDYGEVSAANTLGPQGQGKSMPRLLNDIEEALWGDAPPRPTDLSYELPIDFDPYAVLLAQDYTSKPALSPNLATPTSFFGDHPHHSPHIRTSPEVAQSDTFSPMSSPMDIITPKKQNAVSGDPSIWGVITKGEPLSLEEIGKRRHQEWLANRRAVQGGTL